METNSTIHLISLDVANGAFANHFKNVEIEQAQWNWFLKHSEQHGFLRVKVNQIKPKILYININAIVCYEMEN